MTAIVEMAVVVIGTGCFVFAAKSKAVIAVVILTGLVLLSEVAKHPVPLW